MEHKLDDVEKKYKNEKENGKIKGKELGNQEKKVQVCWCTESDFIAK